MKAILIGGPRHRHEFETDYAPLTWCVPDPEPIESVADLHIRPDPAEPSFRTHVYNRRLDMIGPYAIYVSEDL